MDGSRTIIVVIAGQYGMSTVQMSGTGWDVSSGRLIVRAGDAVAAEFPRGRWTAVIDDEHREPDLGSGALLAARRALTQIATGTENGWLTDIRRIAKVARDGLMEIQTEEITEP